MAQQIEATVLKIGTGSLYVEPQSRSFPTDNITIEEVIDGDINASILYAGLVYYVSETYADLVNAANAGGGGGGNTIYTGDGSLSGDRIVDLSGHYIIFGDGGNNLLTIDPIGYGSSFEATDGTATSMLQLNANLTGNNVFLNFNSSDGIGQSNFLFNSFPDNYNFDLTVTDGVNPNVEIYGDGIAQTLTYTAATHTFNAGNASMVLTEQGFTVGITDGVGGTIFNLNSNSGDGYNFNLDAASATDEVIIFGDADAKTITLTAANGVSQPAPASTTSGILDNSQISFYLDEVGNNLKVAVKYSSGTTKTGTVVLL